MLLKRKLEIIELLIKLKNINSRDNENYTPLNTASFNGHLDIVKYLILNGADKEATNIDGDTF